MAEVKHGGCYDCGSMDETVLFSITATRAFSFNPSRPAQPMTNGWALCSKCFKKEEEKRRG